MPARADTGERPEFVLSPTALGDAFVPAELRGDAVPCMAFYPDHVLVVTTLSDHYNPMQFDLPPRAIGHVELVRPNRIEVVHGFVRGQEPGRQVFKLSRLVVEDRFDQVVEYLGRQGHLFSWIDDGGLHYSRPWTLAAVARGGRSVTSVRVEILSRQPVDMRIDTDHGAWMVVFDAGLIARPAVGTRQQMNAAAIQLHRGRFAAPNGLVLGGLSMFDSDAFRLLVEGEAGVVMHRVHRAIYAAGRRIGIVRGQGDAMRLGFDPPVPELLGVMISLALARPDTEVRPLPQPLPVADGVEIGGGAPGRVLGTVQVATVAIVAAALLVPPSSVPTWVFVVPTAALVLFVMRRRNLDQGYCAEPGITIPLSDPGPDRESRLTHFDLGHLESDGRARLRLHHSASGERYPARTLLRSRRLDADLRALREALGRHAPDHLYSMSLGEDQAILYSRKFDFTELFPWQLPTRQAWLIREPSRRVLARSTEHAFTVWTGAGYSLFLIDDSMGGVLVCHLQAGRIILHNGMVIGHYSPDLRMRLATLQQIHVDAATGLVTMGDGAIGTLRNSTDRLVLETTDQHPEMLLLLILLVFAYPW